MAAQDEQIGGDHYRKLTVQPWQAMQAWMSPEQFSGFLQGNIIKYIVRYRDKGGVTDLEKARHYLDKLMEVEQERSQVSLAPQIGATPDDSSQPQYVPYVRLAPGPWPPPPESDATGFVDVPGVGIEMECMKPPIGWLCTRQHGHNGPCAVYPDASVFPAPKARS